MNESCVQNIVMIKFKHLQINFDSVFNKLQEEIDSIEK